MTAIEVQLRRLRERLAADGAAAGTPAARVDELVDEALAAFDRAAVRDFVPVLVERRVRQALGLAAGSSIGHEYRAGQA